MMLRSAIIGTLVLLGTCFSLFGGEKLQRQEFLQIRMGIPVRIVVYAPSMSVAKEAVDAAYARIREIDRMMSDYDPDSELNRLCREAKIGVPTKVSDEFFTVLTQAKELYDQTEGAFDITASPIVKLWRIARRNKELPDSKKLADARARVGFDFVCLDPENKTVTFRREGIQLDVGGIAKGYAADVAYETLVSHGITRCLVACAGDIRVGDPPPDQTGWRVEVEKRGVSTPDREDPLILLLANQAVSTSGDTYQFLEIDGVRYSHIVDTRTGLGLTTPSSVTVVAPRGILADGLSTCVTLLGPEKGIELVSKYNGIETFLVYLDPEGVEHATASPGWGEIERFLPDSDE